MRVTRDGSEDADIVFMGTDEMLVLTPEEERLASALIARLGRTGLAPGRAAPETRSLAQRIARKTIPLPFAALLILLATFAILASA